jgi:hypothetical protein
MKPERHRSPMKIVTFTCLFLGACNVDQPDLLRSYGFVEGTQNKTLVAAAIRRANLLLDLDTSYQLALKAEAADGRIPVYLVTGDRLGQREYARKFDDERALLINDDRVRELLRNFGIELNQVQELGVEELARSREVKTSSAVSALALVLLHEVGHIWQGEKRPYAGVTSASYEKILETAGALRSVELDADKFVADRLKISARWIDDAHDKPSMSPAYPNSTAAEIIEKLGGGEESRQRFLALHRRDGRRLLAAVEFQRFIYRSLMGMPPRKAFGAQTPVSHLDLDIRLLVYWALAYAPQDVKSADTTANFQLRDRLIEAKFLLARSKVVAAAPAEAARSKYYVFIKLLEDNEQDVRHGALLALRHEKSIDEEMLPHVIDALNEKHGVVPHISYIIPTFGRLATPHLIASLRSPVETVRDNAVLSLLRMTPDDRIEAIQSLETIANDDNSELVRWRARHILKEHRAQ